MGDSLDGITWFRGTSVRIRRDGVEIHVDPIGVDEDSEANIVLLTHPHYDNFSEADIARVRGPNTVIVAPASMKKQLADADHFMRPGDMLQLDGFDVLAAVVAPLIASAQCIEVTPGSLRMRSCIPQKQPPASTARSVAMS